MHSFSDILLTHISYCNQNGEISRYTFIFSSSYSDQIAQDLIHLDASVLFSFEVAYMWIVLTPLRRKMKLWKTFFCQFFQMHKSITISFNNFQLQYGLLNSKNMKMQLVACLLELVVINMLQILPLLKEPNPINFFSLTFRGFGIRRKLISFHNLCRILWLKYVLFGSFDENVPGYDNYN